VTENEVIAWIQANVAAQPDLLPALDAIIAKLDAIPTVQTALNVSDQDWFTQPLRQELAQAASTSAAMLREASTPALSTLKNRS
jgi:hypothetical protein